MIPTQCPQCKINLVVGQVRFGWLSCQQIDHIFFFNLKNKEWALGLDNYYIGYNCEKYYFGSKNSVEVTYIDPFHIEQASDVLNKYIKLILFL